MHVDREHVVGVVVNAADQRANSGIIAVSRPASCRSPITESLRSEVSRTTQQSSSKARSPRAWTRSSPHAGTGRRGDGLAGVGQDGQVALDGRTKRRSEARDRRRASWPLNRHAAVEQADALEADASRGAGAAARAEAARDDRLGTRFVRDAWR